jgi:acetyltransferase-like isoleucine patch superfamily enzyme
MLNVKIFISLVIALIPTNSVRVFLYNRLLKYKLHPTTKVGFLTFIYVKSFISDANVIIGNFNYFKGPIEVKVGNGSRIGKGNSFTCSNFILKPKYKDMEYTPILEIGKGSLILEGHFFDLYLKVSIGDGTWIAGRASQFWTHGLSTMDRDITIGTNNYIGSSVNFAPGTSIGNNNIVALGSVVMSKLTADKFLISGNPAKPYRTIESDLINGKYRFSFNDWD